MFIMFNPSRRTLKPAPHESPSRQTLKLYPHETSPSTTLNTPDLIRDEREGKFIYYELNASVLEEIILWISELKGEDDYDQTT